MGILKAGSKIYVTGGWTSEPVIVLLKDSSVGDVVGDGWEIKSIKVKKNGSLRVKISKWYDSGSDYKDSELLERVYYNKKQ